MFTKNKSPKMMWQHPQNNRSERCFTEPVFDINELVRSIQRSEGQPDCFRRCDTTCTKTDCDWYAYCCDTLR